MTVEMSADERSRIEGKLVAMREELRREIEGEQNEVEQMAQDQADEFTSQHHGDLGTDMFLEERALSTKKALESELSAVERALERVGDGTYGTCENCGQLIPKERLEARPQATRCIDCERQRE